MRLFLLLSLLLSTWFGPATCYLNYHFHDHAVTEFGPRVNGTDIHHATISTCVIEAVLANRSTTLGPKPPFGRRTKRCQYFFHCFMETALEHDKAMFGTSAAIVGLLPTVFSLIGPSTNDLGDLFICAPLATIMFSFFGLGLPTDLGNVLRSLTGHDDPVQRQKSIHIRRYHITHYFPRNSRPIERKPNGEIFLSQRRPFYLNRLFLAFWMCGIAVVGPFVILYQLIGKQSLIIWSCGNEFLHGIWPVLSLASMLVAVVAPTWWYSSCRYSAFVYRLRPSSGNTPEDSEAEEDAPETVCVVQDEKISFLSMSYFLHADEFWSDTVHRWNSRKQIQQQNEDGRLESQYSIQMLGIHSNQQEFEGLALDRVSFTVNTRLRSIFTPILSIASIVCFTYGSTVMASTQLLELGSAVLSTGLLTLGLLAVVGFSGMFAKRGGKHQSVRIEDIWKKIPPGNVGGARAVVDEIGSRMSVFTQRGPSTRSREGAGKAGPSTVVASSQN